MNSESDIVISGIGGYFPNSHNINEYKDFLMQNLHAIDSELLKNGDLNNALMNSYKVPARDLFDAIFFGIHRKQVKTSSFNMRLTLERTFEALIDAGVHPSEIFGERVGVFIASEINDETSILMHHISGFTLLGQVSCLIPNRISYCLNLKGPSQAYFSSWVSGSLVLQQALESIKCGSCESAIVGVNNITMTQSMLTNFANMGVLSSDGMIRAFDANADGYSLSEGIVVFYLQKASQAKRHYATILHASVSFQGNHDNNALTVSARTITNYLSECYEKSNIDPLDVQYIEANGCGVKHIDEQEMEAIEAVFCKNRTKPLEVGSVKPNCGHAKAASDFLSIVKVIIAMECGEIPATINYNNPNPNIQALNNGNIQIVTKNKEWSGGIAAINAIGHSNLLGHVILKSNPKNKVKIEYNIPILNMFATRTEEGINEIIETIKAQPVDVEYTTLINETFNYTNNKHLHRGYVMKGEQTVSEHAIIASDEKQVWFVYSGMGSQWHAMGRELMRLPIFAQAVNKCHAILETKGLDLRNIIMADDPNIFKNILNSFVGIAAIQIGLTDVLYALGIKPDGIIGHSVGELGCAYADGCLTAEQMILSSYYRGMASLEADLIPGMMAAVGMGYSEIKHMCPPEIDVACHNSSTSCTLSGPVDAMKMFINMLVSKNIFARLVNVSDIAYHSRYIRPAEPVLIKYLTDLIKEPKQRSAKWISTSVPQSNWHLPDASVASANYFTNNLLSSVLFEEGLEHIPPNAVAIEIAPYGILQAILKRALPLVQNITLTRRHCNSLDVLFAAIGKIYLTGQNVNVSALYPSLSYPVSRGTRSLCDLVKWVHSETWPSLLSSAVTTIETEKDYIISPRDGDFKYIIDCSILGKHIIPSTTFLALVYKNMCHENAIENVEFQKVHFKEYHYIPLTGTTTLTIMIHSASGYFEGSIASKVYVSGYIITKEISEPSVLTSNAAILQNEITSADFYKELRARGYHISGRTKCIKSVKTGDICNIGLIQWCNDWRILIEAMIQMDIFHAGKSNQQALIPYYIRSVYISFNKLPQEKTDLEVTSSNYTGIINTPGIYISGIHYRKLETNLKEMQIEHVQYINSGHYLKDTQHIAGTLDHIQLIHVSNHSLSYKDIKQQAQPWVKQLYSAVNDITSIDSRLYLVSRVAPLEGIEKFVNQMQETPGIRRLRYIFILDKDAPNCTLYTNYYYLVFEQDTFLSILKNGQWNSYVTIQDSCIVSKDISVQSILATAKLSISANKCTAQYVGLYAKDLTYTYEKNRPCEIGYFDYSAVDATGKKIMGFTKVDCEVTHDSNFVWSVPNIWSMADAATIPYAYTLAYYTLFEIANIKPGHIVFVNPGFTAVGQAALLVASKNSCEVFTTVETEKQRVVLKSLIPKLKDVNILSLEKNQIAIQFMRITQGRGADVILNCLPGEDLHSSKRCAGVHCYFIQLGKTDLETHCETGMQEFNICITLRHVNMDFIFEKDCTLKAKIHKYISDGIKTGHVIPLIGKVISKNKVDDAIRCIKGKEEITESVFDISNELMVTNKSSSYNCEDSGVYLILSDASEKCLELAEWLVKRNAKNILMSTKMEEEQGHIIQRLESLRNLYSAHISLVEKHVDSLKEMINAALKMGKISGIFITDGNSKYESLFHILSVINKSAHGQNVEFKTVFLLENYNHIYLSSKNVMIIRWESERNILDALHVLDKVLLNQIGDTVIKNERVVTLEKTTENDITTFYPITLNNVQLHGKYLPTCTSLIALPSNCSRNERNLSSLFLVPGITGLHCPELKKFVRRLMYPVYGINLCDYDLKNNFASTIAQKILQSLKSETCCIIGIAWGGIAALEIAKNLEQNGVTVQLILIDGAPETIMNYTRNYNNLENTLIQNGNDTPINTNLFTKGMTSLKQRSEFADSYDLSSEYIFSGQIMLLRTASNKLFYSTHMTKCCKKVMLEYFDEKHSSLLESEELITFINDNVHY